MYNKNPLSKCRLYRNSKKENIVYGNALEEKSYLFMLEVKQEAME